MKLKISLLAMFCLQLVGAAAFAQGTLFTYQGSLNDTGHQANGLYDFQFQVFTSNSGGSAVSSLITTNGVTISGGLFTVGLDFGSNVFTGPGRWLQIAVRTNNSATFTALSSRQGLTATPYAMFAGGAGTSANATSATTATNFSGTLLGDVTGSQSATVVAKVGGQTAPLVAAGANAANAASPANVAGSIVARDAAGSFSATTITATNFNGGGSNLTALNASALSTGTVSTNVLAGFQSQNSYNSINGGQANSTVSGSQWATISGGDKNTNYGNATAIGGGQNNTINGTNAAGGVNFQSVVDGGFGNTSSADYSSIGGGENNTVNAYWSTVGGGNNNFISSGGTSATIPGGSHNLASGTDSLAAGQQAQALHQGAFVWADSQNAAFASTTNDQFSVRAQGGVKFVTSGVGVTIDGQPMAKSYGTPISAGGYIISTPGAYFVTTNLTVSSGDCIRVQASGVTLDLNGFTLASLANPAASKAVVITNSVSDVSIANGHIVCSVTNNNGTFTGSGFAYGIQNYGAGANIHVQNISVSGLLVDGINLGQNNGSVCESSTVSGVGGAGIVADSVTHCTAVYCFNNGIVCNTAADDYAQSVNLGGYEAGLVATTAVNCYGISTNGGGIGISAGTATGCSGIGQVVGINAELAINCNGQGLLNSSTGLAANIVNNSQGLAGTGGRGIVSIIVTGSLGQATSGTPIYSTIANSCVIDPANALVYIQYMYNMPAYANTYP